MEVEDILILNKKTKLFAILPKQRVKIMKINFGVQSCIHQSKEPINVYIYT